MNILSSEKDILEYATDQLNHYGRKIAGDCWKKSNINLMVEAARFAVEDTELDDGIEIEINNGKGFVIGSNPRATLIGVYEMLKLLGCRFLRPGPDGEVIPKRSIKEWNISQKHIASNRYRGVVIEGADSLEIVLDFLEWMPKLGFNMFFTQFESISLFLKRFYSHPHNANRNSIDVPNDILDWMESIIIKKIKQLGLLQHTMGHGWTTKAVGINSCDWEVSNVKLTEDRLDKLALIDGKRQFFGGIPIETNLCYSEPQVRNDVIDSVLQYVRNNSNAEFVHFWLADNYHNFCTCETCQLKTPSDWYVILLNELDDALTKENSPVRIVFLNYFDLLWPPIKERLKNPNRFSMIFAPITRKFSVSYADVTDLCPVSPYVLNTSAMPGKLEENMWLLEQWRTVFQGDCFDFDYYMGKAHYGDPGYYGLAHTISRDIDKLNEIGLKGILSCQELRVSFPNSLPSYLLGRRLWDISCDEDEVLKEYFIAAYGDCWQECRDYFRNISNCFDIDYWYSYCRAGINPDIAASARNAQMLAKEFSNFVSTMTIHNSVERLSQFYLYIHVQYVQLFAETIACWAEGKRKAAADAWNLFGDYICENENSIQRGFDVFRILDIGKYMPWQRNKSNTD